MNWSFILLIMASMNISHKVWKITIKIERAFPLTSKLEWLNVPYTSKPQNWSSCEQKAQQQPNAPASVAGLNHVPTLLVPSNHSVRNQTIFSIFSQLKRCIKRPFYHTKLNQRIRTWYSSSNRVNKTAFSTDMTRSTQAIVKMIDLMVSTPKQNPERAQCIILRRLFASHQTEIINSRFEFRLAMDCPIIVGH